jgi:hypothetical protein
MRVFILEMMVLVEMALLPLTCMAVTVFAGSGWLAVSGEVGGEASSAAKETEVIIQDRQNNKLNRRRCLCIKKIALGNDLK